MQGVLKKFLNPSGTPSTLSRLCIEVYVINRNKAFSKRQMGIRFIAVTSQISNDKKNNKLTISQSRTARFLICTVITYYILVK